jgi:hypothetical protein
MFKLYDRNVSRHIIWHDKEKEIFDEKWENNQKFLGIFDIHRKSNVTNDITQLGEDTKPGFKVTKK